MTISPFEARYATEMNAIWTEESRLRYWLQVEIALARAHEDLRTIPRGSARAMEQASGQVKLERVREIEAAIHHDLMAMVKALSERVGEAGKYVHLGATSYDIEDTATALMCRDALEWVKKRLERMQDVLRELAKRHRKTICVGRTHGQQALPTTYGMKFAVYYAEIGRHLERIGQLRERIAIGKMSGAVGTMAGFHGNGREIQKRVMAAVGLKAAVVSNQIIQRDRHAEVVAFLALVAGTVEKMAKEIRNLQRTEIAEVAEAFEKKQVGSSAMPHKRNPHQSERLCSLARMVRAYAGVALENMALEHERDLTNSANERILLPESFICTDYMLKSMADILEHLEFFPENIQRNLECTQGGILAERLMGALVEKGMPRQEAHERVRELAIEARDKGMHLREVAKEKIKQLNAKEIERIFEIQSYIGEAVELVDMVLKRDK